MNASSLTSSETYSKAMDDNYLSSENFPSDYASNLIGLFLYSAGALLLAASMMMFLSILAGIGLGHPHDSLSGMTTPTLFWIVGGFELLIALICLFGKRLSLQLTLVFWLAINSIVCQLVLWCTGVSAGFKGYLGDVSAAFGISCTVADVMMKILIVYLLTCSVLSLLFLWIRKKSSGSQCNTNGYLKTSCPACGGHIRFPFQNLGHLISCPHCQKTITLRKPDLLKLACSFCHEHIEFPNHAIGERIPCPHCKMDITLTEPP